MTRTPPDDAGPAQRADYAEIIGNEPSAVYPAFVRDASAYVSGDINREEFERRVYEHGRRAAAPDWLMTFDADDASPDTRPPA